MEPDSTSKLVNARFTVPSYYWLCATLFLGLGVLCICLAYGNDADARTGRACAPFFLAVAFLAFAWPILRKKEGQGIRIERIRSASMTCDAIFLPASKVKQYIVLLGSFAFGAGALSLAYYADNFDHRAKGLLGGSCLMGVFAIALREFIQGRKFGVLLLPEGIVWTEMFRAPYVIPWDEISNTAVFMKLEKYNRRVPAFGICVKDPEMVRTSSRSRKKLSETFRQTGFHLFFYAETLLVPLYLAEQAVHFYASHPEKRVELNTGTASERVKQMSSLLDQ